MIICKIPSCVGIHGSYVRSQRIDGQQIVGTLCGASVVSADSFEDALHCTGGPHITRVYSTLVRRLNKLVDNHKLELEKQ